MAEATLDLPRRESGLLKALKSVVLLRESVVGMIGAAIIFFWVFIAITAGLLAPFEPNATLKPLQPPLSVALLKTGQKLGGENVQDVCAPADDGSPGQFNCGTFWLGTDHIGRDILSRIMHGARRVLVFGILATICAYGLGIPMGLAAGYVGGLTDEVLSFIANVILSFPILVLYVIIIATIGASAVNIMIAVMFASGPGIMRIVRGLVLDLRSREYVFAAQTRGESAWRIMVMEILPNARGPLIVDVCLRLGYVIITIGVLGFLGLGLPPPDPDWGGMINETRQMAMVFPHMSLFPCIAISSIVLGFNLLADGLREISLRD